MGCFVCVRYARLFWVVVLIFGGLYLRSCACIRRCFWVCVCGWLACVDPGGSTGELDVLYLSYLVCGFDCNI